MDGRHKYFQDADGELDPVGDVNQYPSRQLPLPVTDEAVRVVPDVAFERGDDETPRSRLRRNNRGRWV